MVTKWIEHLKLCLLMLGVIIFGSIGNILTPIIVSSNQTSTYVILLLNSVESFMIYFFILIGIMCYKGTFMVFRIKIELFLLTSISGIISGLIGVCFLYASDPVRTPVIIQSILLGISILPNVIFYKIYFEKAR